MCITITFTNIVSLLLRNLMNLDRSNLIMETDLQYLTKVNFSCYRYTNPMNSFTTCECLSLPKSELVYLLTVLHPLVDGAD